MKTLTMKSAAVLLTIGGLAGCHSTQDPANTAHDDMSATTKTVEHPIAVAIPTEDGEEPEVDLVVGITLTGQSTDCGEVPIYFETDSAELTPEHERTLDSLASCLQGTTQKEDLTITGTADPRGTSEYNEALSQRRAQTVADYLGEKGVSEDSFHIHARGESGATEGMPRLWPTQRKASVETDDG